MPELRVRRGRNGLLGVVAVVVHDLHVLARIMASICPPQRNFEITRRQQRVDTGRYPEYRVSGHWLNREGGHALGSSSR
eukprot:754200-Hanusia_phi.AAC.10